MSTRKRVLKSSRIATRAGMTKRVSSEANASPQTSEVAMGPQVSDVTPDPRASGSNPRIVVEVVRKMGRIRSRPLQDVDTHRLTLRRRLVLM